MNVKPKDPYEVIKFEPNVSGQTQEKYCASTTKQQIMFNIHNDHDYGLEFYDSDKSDNIFSEFKTDQSQTQNSLNSDEIKQEIFECEESKIEYRSWDLPIKNENDQLFFATIKKEPPDNSDVVVEKQEVSENKQAKIESELLTSCCDLPTLKSESDEYPDNLVQPCSSKNAGRTLKTYKTMVNVSKTTRRRYPCAVCQKDFPSSKSRSSHIDGHFEKRFAVCQFSGRIMKQIDFYHNFFNHVVKNKVKNHIADKSLKCNISSKKLKRKNIEDVIDKSFKCGTCDKTFGLKYNLRQHLSIHNGEQTFKCDICSKGFTLKSSLQRHLKIHTGEKPFKCDICSNDFTQKQSLQQHLVIHSGQTPFKCKVCSKCFNAPSNLRLHLRIHSGKKPFKCEICSKCYNRKYTLQRHLINIHNKGEKLFKCDICSKGYTNKQLLQKHLIIHKGEKPFKCNICFKEFRLKYNFQKHVRIHTK